MRWPPHNSENGFQKRLSEKCSLPKIDRGVAFTRFVKWFHYPSARAPPAGLDIYIYYAAACRRVASLAAVALPLPFAAPPFDSRPALAADVPTRLSLLALSQTASCCTISPGAARAAFLLVAHGVVDKLLVRDALPVAVVGQSRGAPPHSRHFNVVQLVEAPFFHLCPCGRRAHVHARHNRQVLRELCILAAGRAHVLRWPGRQSFCVRRRPLRAVVCATGSNPAAAAHAHALSASYDPAWQEGGHVWHR